jgi:hypothetical protein
MSDTDDLDAWIDANAALHGLVVAPEWRDAVRSHLRITREHAQHVMDFELSDDADPAPVFHA